MIITYKQKNARQTSTQRPKHNVQLHMHTVHSQSKSESSAFLRGLDAGAERMSRHTEGSPHEIEDHVARFQPDYRVGLSTHRDLRDRGVERSQTPWYHFSKQISTCCFNNFLYTLITLTEDFAEVQDKRRSIENEEALGTRSVPHISHKTVRH